MSRCKRLGIQPVAGMVSPLFSSFPLVNGDFEGIDIALLREDSSRKMDER